MATGTPNVADIADDWGLADIAREYATTKTAETDIVSESGQEITTATDIVSGFGHGWESAQVCIAGRQGRVSHRVLHTASTLSNPLLDHSLYQVN